MGQIENVITLLTRGLKLYFHTPIQTVKFAAMCCKKLHFSKVVSFPFY